MYHEAKEIMARAGMNLTKWRSNEKTIFSLENELQEAVKVLGVKWSTEEDLFQFDGIQISDNIVVTKRIVLSTLARIFDPLGFIAPVVMTGKILFQKLWELGLAWDEEIPEELCQQFRLWISSLEKLKTIQIPRKYTSVYWDSHKDEMKIHVYADSSELGYGAVVYLSTPEEPKEKSTLVISKARVAPLKKITLPRLELLACLLAARLLAYVKNALQIPEVRYSCWSDSTVALSWIKGNPNRFKQFVANRVQEIQSLTDPESWLYVPGKKNPADILTRGFEAVDLISSELWWQGPPDVTSEETVLNQSFKENIDHSEDRTVMTNASSTRHPAFETQRWSSLNKAVNIVCLVLKFIKKLKRKTADRQCYGRSLSCNRSDQEEALLTLVCQEQIEQFHTEMELLKQGRKIPKSSKLYSLNPFIDEDGMLRVKGRIAESQLSYAEKHPIILDNCWLSTLIVRDRHKKLKHAGVDTVITNVRTKFWIIGLRRIAKTVLKSCVNCQRMSKKRCDQDQSSLPKDRVTKKEPFDITGVDFAGPLYASDKPGHKLYICLYTCAVTRAVHLELTESLTTQAFVLSFRRFAARRNLPIVVYSDNAKTFKAAPERLKEIYGTDTPTWKYIIPRAPWWGGWWERMVRNVKSALKRCLGKALITKAELESLLAEIEKVVNSRPLTQVTDVLENQRPLCPNDFLQVKDLSSHQDNASEIQGCYGRSPLIKMYCDKQKLLQKFWEIWAKDYLQSLPKLVPQFAERNTLKKGSIVLIHDDSVPRLQWPMGKVINVYPGKDGKVRSVQMQTLKGQITRPIQRLCQLEGVTFDGMEGQDGEAGPESEPDPELVPGPARQATMKRDCRQGDKIPQESVFTRSGRMVKKPQRLDL